MKMMMLMTTTASLQAKTPQTDECQLVDEKEWPEIPKHTVDTP
jgi:hypothetical protein